MANVTLSTTNTIALSTGVATRLLPSDGGATAGIHKANVLNLGAGNVFLRADADPTSSDPAAEKLPANYADNSVAFVGFLGVISDAATTITVRLTS